MKHIRPSLLFLLLIAGSAWGQEDSIRWSISLSKDTIREFEHPRLVLTVQNTYDDPLYLLAPVFDFGWAPCRVVAQNGTTYTPNIQPGFENYRVKLASGESKQWSIPVRDVGKPTAAGSYLPTGTYRIEFELPYSIRVPALGDIYALSKTFQITVVPENADVMTGVDRITHFHDSTLRAGSTDLRVSYNPIAHDDDSALHPILRRNLDTLQSLFAFDLPHDLYLSILQRCFYLSEQLKDRRLRATLTRNARKRYPRSVDLLWIFRNSPLIIVQKTNYDTDHSPPLESEPDSN